MGSVRRRALGLVAVAVTLAGLLGPAGPASAAAAPAPVSHISMTSRTHSTVTIAWWVPAAVYDPGASVVVRYAVAGPPQAPNTGAAARFTTYPKSAQAVDLPAGTTIYFAVWVKVDGSYSAVRTLRAQSLPYAPPPPVSNLAVYGRYDHTLRVSWSVPAAVYDPGATVIVRMTRGRTPAASPTVGYLEPFYSYPHIAQARPLTSDAVYTFAVWVRDHGVYSARRTISTSTLADTTPPHAVSQPAARPLLADGPLTSTSARAALSWIPGDDVDYAGVRILRTSTDFAHAVEITRTAPGIREYRDPAPLTRDRVYAYYVEPIDTSGLLGPYSKVVVTTDERRIGGTLTLDSEGFGLPVVFDSQGHPVATDEGSVAADDSWYVDVRPGTYSVCEITEVVPGAHEQFVPGCYGADGGTYDWTSGVGTQLPPPAVGAVVVTTADRLTGINLSLHT